MNVKNLWKLDTLNNDKVPPFSSANRSEPPCSPLSLKKHLSIPRLIFLWLSSPSLCYLAPDGVCTAEQNVCDQICVPTKEGFYCKCKTGYEIHPLTNRTCFGKYTWCFPHGRWVQTTGKTFLKTLKNNQHFGISWPYVYGSLKRMRMSSPTFSLFGEVGITQGMLEYHLNWALFNRYGVPVY